MCYLDWHPYLTRGSRTLLVAISLPWATCHRRSLLVRVVFIHQQHCIKYVLRPPSWDPPWCSEPGNVCWKQVEHFQAPVGDGLGPWGCQEKQSLERKVGSQSSVGFSSGYSLSCWTCSAGDSQGWVTLDNKTLNS